MSPQARETKAKVKKWDCIKLKSFCTVKEITNKTKTLAIEWEKIFASDISGKGLISQIYKTHTTQHQKMKQMTEKQAEDMNFFVFQRRHIDGNGHMKNAQHFQSSGKCKLKSQ